MDSIRLAQTGSVFPQIPCCRCADNTRAWDRLAGKTYCPNCTEALAMGEAEPIIEKTDKRRCTICHHPHGSIADKMLIQRDNNLCLKCHAQVATLGGQIFIGEVPHTTFVSRGACWSAGCHTAVHGSNIDRKLRH